MRIKKTLLMLDWGDWRLSLPELKLCLHNQTKFLEAPGASLCSAAAAAGRTGSMSWITSFLTLMWVTGLESGDNRCQHQTAWRSWWRLKLLFHRSMSAASAQTAWLNIGMSHLCLDWYQQWCFSRRGWALSSVRTKIITAQQTWRTYLGGKSVLELMTSRVTDTFRVHWGLGLTRNIHFLERRAQQRLYFLRTLKIIHLSHPLLLSFYHRFSESILTYGILVWFGCSSQKNASKTSKKKGKKSIRFENIKDLTTWGRSGPFCSLLFSFYIQMKL